MNSSNIRPLSYKDVQINDSFWSRRMERMAQEVIPYQWDALNDNIPGAEPSHAIENFRIAAGQAGGTFHGMVFQDSDVAKWLEAASYSLISHPDAALERTIDAVVDLMAAAQQPDGYLNTYFTVAQPDGRWRDFTNGHELYCAGHLIEAAVAHYQVSGKRKFLDIMCRYADYIDAVIGPGEGKMKVYCGHEEIELALIKLYRATGERRYLELCRYFLEERGQQPSFLSKEATFGDGSGSQWYQLDYHQAHAPLREQTTAEGHAVRAMYLYAAMADLARETGDESFYETVRKLWENVTNYRMYITGALGSQSHAERFTFDYDLPNDTAYAETCATIGLIFWAQRMLLLDPDRRYADTMERALYNGVLGGISWDGKKYFYVNPLEVFPEAVAKRYDLQHVKPERQQWFGCACCPPNIARLITSLGQYIYSLDRSCLYVHLFIGSQTRAVINDQPVTLSQETNYPWDGKVTVTLDIPNPAEFALAIRIPSWCASYQSTINDQLIGAELNKGYLKLERVWRRGDRIELNLEMPVGLIRAHPKVREDIGKVAIQRGPLIYCLEETDNGNRLWETVLSRNSKLSAEFAAELCGGAVVIRGDAERLRTDDVTNQLYGKAEAIRTEAVKIQAVPYYLWGNREPGEMLVWMMGK